MKPKNIVFTGMMGCGKTTAGKMVAQLNQMQFLDLDQMIEQRWGSPLLFRRSVFQGCRKRSRIRSQRNGRSGNRYWR